MNTPLNLSDEPALVSAIIKQQQHLASGASMVGTMAKNAHATLWTADDATLIEALNHLGKAKVQAMLVSYYQYSTGAAQMAVAAGLGADTVPVAAAIPFEWDESDPLYQPIPEDATRKIEWSAESGFSIVELTPPESTEPAPES